MEEAQGTKQVDTGKPLLHTFARVGVCERQGMRPSMEDKAAMHGALSPNQLGRSSSFMAKGTMKNLLDKNGEEGDTPRIPEKVLGFFGVFDGHGGKSSAEFVCSNLPQIVCRCLQRRTIAYKEVLVDGFNKCDKSLREYFEGSNRLPSETRSGCTAVTVLLEYDSPTDKCTVHCANLGDSRCIIVKHDGGYFPMSNDHVPSDEGEKMRITNAGGEVRPARPNSSILRVFGVLSVTRSFGDFQFKMPLVAELSRQTPITSDLVISTPDVESVEIDKEKDLCLLLACDGVWNTFTNGQAAEFVSKHLKEAQAKFKRRTAEDDIYCCQLVAEKLTEEAIARGSTDNCTAMLLIPQLVLADQPTNSSRHCTIV